MDSADPNGPQVMLDISRPVSGEVAKTSISEVITIVGVSRYDTQTPTTMAIHGAIQIRLVIIDRFTGRMISRGSSGAQVFLAPMPRRCLNTAGQFGIVVAAIGLVQVLIDRTGPTAGCEGLVMASGWLIVHRMGQKRVWLRHR